MARIIPGVQVTVVKEVVTPQLAPSGVLGLIGLTEIPLTKVERAASWNRFMEVCGSASAYSIPEARLALANGVYELVIVPLNSSTSVKASVELIDNAELVDIKTKSNAATEATKKSEAKPDDTNLRTEAEVATKALTDAKANYFKLEARAAGSWANNLRLKVTYRSEKFDLEIKSTVSNGDNAIEAHRNLEPTTFVEILEKVSSVVHIPTTRLKSGEYLLVGGTDASSTSSGVKASVNIENTESKKFKLEANNVGIGGNDLKLIVSDSTNESEKFDLEIKSKDGTTLEVHRNLDPHLFIGILKENSKVIHAFNTTKRPSEGEYVLVGGKDASATEYSNSLEALKDESDVDMVLAAIQDFSNATNVTQVYSDVISHCQLMSADSKGRIGLGHVPSDASLELASLMANTLLSDRFVLLAPNGVAGAVAGRIGGLEYYQSPTFKTISGIASLSRTLPLEEQGGLLKANVVPIVNQKGRGVIVLRGLTTDGDQISVRRVADRAVRGTRMIGELFIGSLNNEDGRGALKQKLIEFLAQMQKEGALVPSTDGKDSAFKVNVYSSQADFAQGIVRVDIAVRPVRAIDFIYATIFVQV
jgi:hypothetical protein